MNTRTTIQQMLMNLQASISRLKSKGQYRLVFYKGVISPQHIDMAKSDLLGQALHHAPDGLQCLADIGLDVNNDLSPTDPTDPSIRSQVNPMISAIRDYLGFFLKIFNKT